MALPFDTIKSVVQVQGVNLPPLPGRTSGSSGGAAAAAAAASIAANKSINSDDMIKAAMKLIKQEGGLRRLFRGWQGAFGRAVPGSATTLATFDIVKERL